MNIVILSGNISQIYDNGDNVRISIADNYKDKTNYIPISLYGNNAQFARQWLQKGDHVSIEGRIGIYKTSDGKNHLSVIALRVNFEGYKNPHKNEVAYTYNKSNGISREQLDDMSTVFEVVDDDVLETPF